MSEIACSTPSGYVTTTGDCDDTDPNVNPGVSPEACDGVDDDCDGTVDEGYTYPHDTQWCRDTDADGYGTASACTTDCEPPSGYVDNDEDCDDSDSSVYPGATETCDYSDEDCDGTVDDDAADASTWYADDDGDGYGDSSDATTACDEPTGYGSDYSDCDDSCSSCYPGGTESCDGYDNDCDGSVDEAGASDCTAYYYDYDGDDYGTSSSACLCSASGYYRSTNSSDCDDSHSGRLPRSDRDLRRVRQRLRRVY